MKTGVHRALLLSAVLLSSNAIGNPNDVDVQALINDGQAETVAEQMVDRLDSEGPSADAHYWLAQAQLAQLGSASVFRQMGLARTSRKNLEAALELDATHVPARQSLGQFYLQAPAIAGGSKDKARAQAEILMDLDPGVAYRLLADIANEDDEPESAIALGRKALQVGTWTWEAQYSLVVEAVHHQVPETGNVLNEAVENVNQHTPDPAARLSLIDYQRGKYAATSGKDLDEGHAALKRYLGHEPAEGEPSTDWAEFRLAQIERQMGDRASGDRRLARLEANELPENLGFAIEDERRWHYAD